MVIVLEFALCAHRFVLIFIDPVVENHVGDLAVFSSALKTPCDHYLYKHLPVRDLLYQSVLFANLIGSEKNGVLDFLKCISELVH